MTHIGKDMATLGSQITALFKTTSEQDQAISKVEAAARDAREVRSFNSVYAIALPPKIETATTTAVDTIVYIPQTDTFVAKKGSKYFANWASASDIGEQQTADGWTPSAAYIYRCGGMLYCHDGTGLRSVDHNASQTANEADIKADRALECLAGLRLEVVSEERWEQLAESGEADDSVLYLMPEEDD